MNKNRTPDSNPDTPPTFLLWPLMKSSTRLFWGAALFLAGLVTQYITFEVWIGAILLFLGNLLFLTRGVRNSQGFPRNAKKKWERAEITRINELLEFDKKIARWNLSAWDISNPLGLLVFLTISAGCITGYVIGLIEELPFLRILSADAAVLLLPHWFSGMRRSHRIPGLILRAKSLAQVIKLQKTALEPLQVEAMFEIPETGEPQPSNVKLRIQKPDLPESFLGLEVHVSVNQVQSSSYPYLYCVLIAKNDFGLDALVKGIPARITAEFKVQDDVEVLVLRQPTTKNSGYHTQPAIASAILAEGIAALGRISVPQ